MYCLVTCTLGGARVLGLVIENYLCALLRTAMLYFDERYVALSDDSKDESEDVEENDEDEGKKKTKKKREAVDRFPKLGAAMAVSLEDMQNAMLKQTVKFP
jgi:hypothetical protein